MKNDQKDTSFVGHLVELRERLIHSIIFFLQVIKSLNCLIGGKIFQG